MLNDVQLRLLEEIADLHGVPEGAYNIRANGEMAERNTTANVDIISKTDASGIDIRVKPGTKKESIHIPVVLSKSGIKETVYNDFYIVRQRCAHRGGVRHRQLRNPGFRA